MKLIATDFSINDDEVGYTIENDNKSVEGYCFGSVGIYTLDELKRFMVIDGKVNDDQGSLEYTYLPNMVGDIKITTKRNGEYYNNFSIGEGEEDIFWQMGLHLDDELEVDVILKIPNGVDMINMTHLELGEFLKTNKL